MTTSPAEDGSIDSLVSVKGHHVTKAPAGRGSALPGDLQWQESYDRESLERFALEVAAEKARLTVQIDAARRRIDAARSSVASNDAANLLQIAQQELQELEREHREIIGLVQATADAEAARLVDEAKREAEALRSLHRPPAPVER